MAAYPPGVDFLGPDKIKAEQWTQDKILGSGGFGMVSLWVNEETNETLAVKKCKVQSEMTEKHKHRWKLEVQIMQEKIDHENVVTAKAIPNCIIKVFEGEVPLLGMEYCSGGDLRKLLQKKENCCGLTEYMVRNITRDITAGMEYLHSKRIIHRDIKPENVVIQLTEEKPIYKLIDLGYAKDLNEGSICSSFVGTYQYLAPELMVKDSRYISSVDYWSLGIIVFECITGFRPFFHSEPPTRTFPLVQKKAMDDIWSELDNKGTAHYAKKLPPHNQLCRTSRAYFEQFLRLVLLIDPRARGGGFGENKRPKCFILLDNILNMKLIHILDVASNQVYSYPAPETHQLEDVQRALQMEVKMPLSDQELLLPTGVSPDTKASATSCGEEQGEIQNIVFLFRKAQTRFVKNDRKNVSLPGTVQQMVQDPKLILPYPKQKIAWGHAIFFCREQAKEYKRLLLAQRALMLNLLRSNSKLSKLKTSMLTMLNSLSAKTEFSRESLELDLDKYKQQADEGGITSEKIFNNWKKMLTDLSKLDSISKQVQELEESSVGLNTKNVELQRSPFSKATQTNDLERLEHEAADLYEKLKQARKEKKSGATTHNALMIKVVVKCVTQKQACILDLYQHLEKLSATKLEVLALIPKIENVLKQMAEATEKLSRNQEIRQKDVWRLLSVSVKKSKKAPTADPSPVSRSISDTSQTQLASSVFDRLTEQSMSLKNVSVDTRQLMSQAVTSLAPTVHNEVSDWSFLEEATSLLSSLS